ncbi:unnamed protein product [Dibothriocephalus latus]|uniref:Uncharacterized protein n=1 Tax=Dibothriocephalus latus TaxID=60516 RepID=A0A3P7KY58_DIBLA|nr:unnamed protein product [Dibothriocephalus latus]
MDGSERGSLLHEDNPDGVASPRTVYLTNGKSVVKQNGTTELQKEPSVSSYSVAQFSPISDAESVETEVDDRLTSNAPKSCSPRRARNFKHEIIPPCYSEVHSSSNLASVMANANPSSSQPGE